LPPPPPIPTSPTIVSPVNGSTSQPVNLTLSWNAAVDAATYGVQVSTSSNFSSLLVNDIGVTTLTKSLAGLTEGTTYYWRINATNVSGTSPWSAVNSFSTVAPPVTAIPAAPVLSSPSNMAKSQVTSPTLTWSAVTGATGYGLQVSTDVNFLTTTVNLTGLTSVNRALTGLTDGTTYYWRVNASNSGGISPWSSVFSFTTSAPVVPPGGSILSVPTLQLPADRATGISRTPILTWTPIAGAVSYDVQISTSTAFTSNAIDLTGVPANSAQISTLLDSRRLYYWRVRAVNGSAVSGWSAVRRFTTTR